MLPLTRRVVLRSLAAALGAAAAVLLLRAADTPKAAPSPSMAQALEGTWVHVGEPGDIQPAPKTGGRLKFRGGGRWTLTSADSAKGHVKEHFGGTYTVRGNEYTETIDYSLDRDDPELGKSIKFTVTVEGDLMTQRGIDNPYTEVWKRVR